MTDMSENAAEKATATVSSVEDNESQRPKSVSSTVKYLYHLPWTSALELLGVLVTIIGASILVALLNHKEQWPTEIHIGTVRGKELNMALITPQVILSLTHSIIAFLIGLAVKDGITMAWWRRTLVGGTVKRLDRDYKFGTSLKDALLSGKHLNIIALATIGAAIAALTQGPLMQRSLTVYLDYSSENTVVETKFATEFPYGFSGVATGTNLKSAQTSLLTLKFANVMMAYSKNMESMPNITGCTGQCTMNIAAAGFVPTCTNVTEDYTFHSGNAPSLFSVAFYDDFEEVPSEHDNGTLFSSTIRMDVHFAQLSVGNNKSKTADGRAEQICQGTVTKRSCVLRPATIIYPVIHDTEFYYTMINYPEAGPLHLPVAANLKVVTNASSWDGKSTIGGITTALNNTFLSNYTLGDTDGDSLNPLEVKMSGIVPMLYLNLTSDDDFDAWRHDCTQSFSDPTSDIILAVNDISLRSSMAIVEGIDTPTKKYNATQLRSVSRYKANWPYLAASLAVTILGVAMIVPAFYGWWQLGRKVSLNPIEMAEAFNAPVLRQQECVHKDADHLLELVGDRKVKYAPVDYETPGHEGVVKRMEMVNVDASDRPEVVEKKPARWVGGWNEK